MRVTMTRHPSRYLAWPPGRRSGGQDRDGWRLNNVTLPCRKFGGGMMAFGKRLALVGAALAIAWSGMATADEAGRNQEDQDKRSARAVHGTFTAGC